MTDAPRIHPTAIVADGAQVADDVSIAPYAVIGPQVVVGSGCTIGAHATLNGDTVLGTGNRVFPHAAIGEIPQDLKYAGEATRLVIGDNNTFREFTTLHPGTEGGGGVTTVGDGNLFMAYAHVAHDCVVGNGTIFANQATLGGHVTVGDQAVVGGLSAVHQFVKIGRLAMIGGCTGVDQDIPPFCMAIGNRASLRGLNLTGLKRAGVRREGMRALKNAYDLLFKGDAPLADAVKTARQTWPDDPQVAALTAFIDASERGVCR